MSQCRLNYLAVLHVHQDRVDALDALDLHAIHQEFVAKTDYRKKSLVIMTSLAEAA
jgi:hypothetical protein